MLENPFLYSLAITLVHFIWQGCLVALVLKLLLTFISSENPQLRYALTGFAMLANLALPITTFFMIYQADFERLTNSNEILITLANNISASNDTTLSTSLLEYLPFLALAWLCCVTYLSLKLIFDIHYVNRLTKVDVFSPETALQARFIQLAQNIGITSMPTLLVSLKADIPMAIGWLKPVVLLPVSMLSGLTTAQLEMLLLHELAHIKRHDYLVNFFQTLIEILLFFHPAVRWVSTKMRNEREFCSDDIAVQHCCKPIAYAKTLTETAALCQLNTQKSHHSIPQMALAASGGDLKQRVIRLVDSHCTSSNNLGKWFAGMFLLTSLLIITSKQFLTLPLLNDNLGYFPFYPKQNDETTLANTNKADNHVDLAQTPIAQQLLNNTNKLNENSELPVNNVAKTKTKQVKQTKAKHIKPSFTEKNTEFLVEKQPVKSKQALTTTKNQAVKKPAVSNTITNKNNITVISKRTDSKPTNKAQASKHKKAVKIAKHSSTPATNNLASTRLTAVAKKQLPLSPIAKNTPSKSALDTLNTTATTPLTRLEKTTKANVLNQYQQPKNKYAQQLAQLTQPKPDSAPAKIYQASKPRIVKQPARLLSSIAPKYPAIAKRKKLELEILVNFTIDTHGYVKNIVFEQQPSKSSYFRRAIRTALKKWYFAPAKVNGKAVETNVARIFSFSLTD